jgi:hypothetical protein
VNERGSELIVRLPASLATDKDRPQWEKADVIAFLRLQTTIAPRELLPLRALD